MLGLLLRVAMTPELPQNKQGAHVLPLQEKEGRRGRKTNEEKNDPLFTF